MSARPSLVLLSPGVWEKYEGRGKSILIEPVLARLGRRNGSGVKS